MKLQRDVDNVEMVKFILPLPNSVSNALIILQLKEMEFVIAVQLVLIIYQTLKPAYLVHLTLLIIKQPNLAHQ